MADGDSTRLRSPGPEIRIQNDFSQQLTPNWLRSGRRSRRGAGRGHTRGRRPSPAARTSSARSEPRHGSAAAHRAEASAIAYHEGKEGPERMSSDGRTWVALDLETTGL